MAQRVTGRRISPKHEWLRVRVAIQSRLHRLRLRPASQCGRLSAPPGYWLLCQRLPESPGLRRRRCEEYRSRARARPALDRNGTSGRGRYRPLPAHSVSETRREFRPPSFRDQLRPERWKCSAMIAAEIEALSAIGYGSDEDRFMRTKIVAWIGLWQLPVIIAMNRDQIENGGSEMLDRPAFAFGHIARHCERFQIYLRPHDRGAETEKDAAFQTLNSAGKDQEIAIARLPERRTVAVGMLVQDIVADPGVYGRRNRQPPCSRQHAEIAMRKTAFGDPPPGVFT